MNAFTYVLIFLVVGGFADLAFGNSEQSNKSQQLLSEIAKSNSTGSERPEINKEGKIIKKLYDQCDTDFDCGISNSSCQSGRCQCRNNFFPTENGTCLEILSELHGSCKINEQCAVSLSECSNGECKCKEYEYIEHNNRCYAPKGRKCNTAEDCALIWFDCIEGTCQDAAERKGDVSSKPGATAIWNEDKYDYPYWSFPSYFNASTSHDVGDRENLAWVKNFKLDRVVAVDWFNPIKIYCRAKNSTGEFVPGAVDFSKNNKFCQVNHRGQKFSTEDYEVYVDLGPEN